MAKALVARHYQNDPDRFGSATQPIAIFPIFRGTPHQLAAIKELEESVPKELLEEDSDWFGTWRESGRDLEVYMPYFSQRDNRTGFGYRECFSSAAAMVAAYYKKVKTDDEYIAIRSKYGDTTSVEANLKALRELGLTVEFRKDGDSDLVELEVESGRPVLVGWLHYGNLLLGNHRCVTAWDVVIGASSVVTPESTATIQSGSCKIPTDCQTW